MKKKLVVALGTSAGAVMRQLVVALVAIGLTASVGAYAAMSTGAQATEITVPQKQPGFFLGLTGLYDKPSISGNDLPFADNDNEMYSGHDFNNLVHNIDLDHHLGFAVFDGYDFGNGNDVALSYLRLHTANRVSVPPVIAEDNSIGKAEVNLDQIDLVAGQYINIGSAQLHLFAGARYAHLDYAWLKRDFIDNENYDSLQEKSRFRGIGPLAGVNGNYYLGYGIDLVVAADLALLAGKTDNNVGLINDWTSDLGDKPQVVPVADAKLGLDYTYSFQNYGSLTLEAGYHVSRYWSVIGNDVMDFGEDPNESANLGYKGPYVTLTYRNTPTAVDTMSGAQATEITVPQKQPGFFLGLTGLYDKPSISNDALNYSWHIFGENNDRHKKYYDIDPGHHLGFSVSGGYDFGNGNDVTLSYLRLHTDDTSIFPVDKSVIGKAEVNLNQVDLVAGQYVNIGSAHQLHWFAGVRYARLDYDWFTRAFVDNKNNLQKESHFKGIGPLVGVNGNYYLGYGIGLVAAADTALLAGKMGGSNHINSPGLFPQKEADFSADNLKWRVVPVADAKLGLDYTYSFQNYGSLTLEAGYHVSHYWHAVEHNSYHFYGANSMSTDTYIGDSRKIFDNVGYKGPYITLTYRAAPTA